MRDQRQPEFFPLRGGGLQPFLRILAAVQHPNRLNVRENIPEQHHFHARMQFVRDAVHLLGNRQAQPVDDGRKDHRRFSGVFLREQIRFRPDAIDDIRLFIIKKLFKISPLPFFLGQIDFNDRDADGLCEFFLRQAIFFNGCIRIQYQNFRRLFGLRGGKASQDRSKDAACDGVLTCLYVQHGVISPMSSGLTFQAAANCPARAF